MELKIKNINELKGKFTILKMEFVDHISDYIYDLKGNFLVMKNYENKKRFSPTFIYNYDIPTKELEELSLTNSLNWASERIKNESKLEKFSLTTINFD